MISLSRVVDTGASMVMTSNVRVDSIREDREGCGFAKAADERLHPIEGFGRLVIDFRSDEGSVPLLLPKLARVPTLDHSLLSLRELVDRGHS